MQSVLRDINIGKCCTEDPVSHGNTLPSSMRYKNGTKATTAAVAVVSSFVAIAAHKIVCTTNKWVLYIQIVLISQIYRGTRCKVARIFMPSACSPARPLARSLGWLKQCRFEIAQIKIQCYAVPVAYVHLPHDGIKSGTSKKKSIWKSSKESDS